MQDNKLNNVSALKAKKFKILIVGLTLIIVGLFFILNLYNKPFIDIKNSNPKIKVTAQKILKDFQVDENLANEKYVDNLILIKGKIANISYDNGISIITLEDANGFSSIICHMLPEASLNVLKQKKDDQIMVKGICTGYLLDVMMVRCVLTNDNFNEK